MPVLNLKVKTNDGNGTYIDIDSGNFFDEKPTVTTTGLKDLLRDVLNSVGEGATYADNVLTLPITIKGFADTANATIATHNIGDSIDIPNGSTTIYAVPDSNPTLTFKHFYDAGTIGTGTIKFRHYSQQEPSSGETWVLNETLPTVQ